jgi:site-specific DNA recombinase
MSKWARYIRISDDEQSIYSIDAQLKATEDYIVARGGEIVGTYVDDGRSARTERREGFRQMREDARQGKWDCLVVHRFDRLNRNHIDALAIKMLLRRDYGITVVSCTEPSEHDGVTGSLIEGLLECVAEWYSKNLSSEMAKGRKEKHSQGLHNGLAPFGYVMKDKMLVPEAHETEGVILAFEAYSTGKYGYADIARLLNESGFKSKSGRSFSKDTVREIIRNEVYIGHVRYQETRYNPDGSRNFKAPIIWVKGQHQAIISPELFQSCLAHRTKKTEYKRTVEKRKSYLLKDICYCLHCLSNPQVGADFPSWGKMYCRTHPKHKTAYYRCHSQELGYDCCQSGIRTELIDNQVVALMCHLDLSGDDRHHLITAVSQAIGQKDLESRLIEIRQTIERMEFKFEHGFIADTETYLQKRVLLKNELENASHTLIDDITRATELLDHFAFYLHACGDDIQKKNDLLKLFVSRVYIENGRVAKIELRNGLQIREEEGENRTIL